MLQKYFAQHIISMLHCPLYVLNNQGNILQKYGGEPEVTTLYSENPKFIQKLQQPEVFEVPEIVTDHSLSFVVFREGIGEKEILIAGPVMFSQMEEISGILLLHWHLTGREVSIAEFLDKNRKSFLNTTKVYQKISEDFFDVQENAGHHNPYEQELRELDSIERGDMEALARSISETYTGKIGVLAKDPLRSSKNVAVGNITLASRAAIRGGIGAEHSFSLADSLIRQVEEIDNIPEVETFKREAQFVYARLVEKENRRGRSVKTDNPLVLAVKDYVFSHLHHTIHVSDIAASLGVNPDYLSHLFSEIEKITIVEYIHQEKIKRGENLLKYSDYRIQDIAFYLGFCSQSHFSKVFRKQMGIGPGEYRKKYGNRKKWKTNVEKREVN